MREEEKQEDTRCQNLLRILMSSYYMRDNVGGEKNSADFLLNMYFDLSLFVWTPGAMAGFQHKAWFWLA